MNHYTKLLNEVTSFFNPAETQKTAEEKKTQSSNEYINNEY